MSDYTDYNENLAFPPEGDWAETKPVQNTDRTKSTIELVVKIERLSEELNIRNDLLKECAEFLSSQKMYGVATSKIWNLLTRIENLIERVENEFYF